LSIELRDEKPNKKVHHRAWTWLCGILAVGQIAGLILLTENPARAYVDPGSSLLTLQILGASAAGGLYMLRQKLRKVLTGKRQEAQLERQSGTVRETEKEGTIA
jgi:hypothetical protein